MKIAIHHREGSFSTQWINYCIENNIDYKIVNAYKCNIIEEVDDCDIFMWHHSHNEYKDNLLAKNLLYSLEHSGKIVYPNFKTGWHFDDKISQKQLLEAIKAPLVKSYLFFEKEEALEWINKTTFPKVFKLKGGSGSSNVILIKNQKQARKIILKAFGPGIPIHSFKNYAKEKWNHFKNKGKNPKDLLKILYRLFISEELKRHSSKERDYVYFQDFLPNNSYDIRLIVINGSYAYGMKRMNRKGDFRASGSSNYVYDDIPNEVLKIGFEVSNELNLDTVAFDFIYDESNQPKIVEISYGFGTEGSGKCKKYWDKKLNSYDKPFNPQYWLMQNLLNK